MVQQHPYTKKERVLIRIVNQEGNCYNKTSALSVHNGQSCYDNHWSLLMESGRHKMQGCILGGQSFSLPYPPNILPLNDEAEDYPAMRTTTGPK